MSNTVKINVTLVSRTDLAILVNDGRREVWVPLSQVVEEIEAIDTMIDLHEYQLKQLSYGEFTQANQAAAQRASSLGGQVFFGAQA